MNNLAHQINENAFRIFLKKMKLPKTSTIDTPDILLLFNAYCRQIVSPPLLHKSKNNNKKYTQSDSYVATSPSLGKKQKIVFDFIQKNEGITRAELTHHLNKSGVAIRHSSVTARVCELLEYGLLVVSGSTFDEKTKRFVQTLKTVATG